MGFNSGFKGLNKDIKLSISETKMKINSSLSFQTDTYNDSHVSEAKKHSDSFLSETEKQSHLLIRTTK